VRFAAVLCLHALVLPARASADPHEAAVADVDTEAAKRHFANGLELYGLEHYAEAIAEFEQARAIKPLPAFDFNIGRCHERLERWADAITAYERYLVSAPPFAPETVEIRERMGILRARIAHPRASSHASPHRVLGILGPIAAAVGAAAIVAGTGAYLSVYPDYADQKAKCGPHCDGGEVAALWTRVQRAETAGIALWSAGGALALASIPMLILARTSERDRKYTIAPTVGPDRVGVSGQVTW
jgi:tetratricopeptide (TPR) repeat protein